MNSCTDDDLNIEPSYQDDIDTVDTEEKLQMFMNNAYLSFSNVSAFGAEALMFGDLISDGMFATSYLNTFNLNYGEITNDFGLYAHMYRTILYCNMVINNELVPDSENVSRIKSEAKILRAFSYFHLVNSYSANPTSGLNQEYGVPLVLGNYDISIQPARATVSEVYSQIISDLEEGILNAYDTPPTKNYLTKTAARLILSRVYLTRKADGDIQLALDYATQVLNNSPSSYGPIGTADQPVTDQEYYDYFAAIQNDITQNQPETVWELDLSQDNIMIAGIGSNLSLSSYYERTGTRSSFYFTQSFLDEFDDADVRGPSDPADGGEEATPGLMFTTPGQGNPPGDPAGRYTTKWRRSSEDGNFVRDIKILRFAEASLNRIEALYYAGQTDLALSELNDFAASRGGNPYTGDNLLNDIRQLTH